MKTVRGSEVRPHQRELGPIQMKAALLMILLASLLPLATGLFAQSTIPAGTILPLQLNKSLNSKKSKPGQVVTARLMQDVPLPSGAKIHAGSKAVGRVLDVVEARNGGGAQLSLQFDTLVVSKKRIPTTTSLRALASIMDVEAAQSPNTGPDSGTSEYEWVTDQIGGDVVYGRDRPVTRGSQVVGTSTANGVLVRVASKPGTKCGGAAGGHDLPQALWLFSADACGTYGFADLKIVHAGRKNPVGQITLASEKGNFNVRSGSGILLRVR
jgi:hypothetical protein